MSALDALASEALLNGSGSSGKENGHQGNGQLNGQMNGHQEADAANDGNAVASLAHEEAVGGPPMPPAGQALATLKQQQLGTTIPASSSVTHPHGDGAMAAADGRLDTADLPHTNGYTDEYRIPAEPAMSADVDQPISSTSETTNSPAVEAVKPASHPPAPASASLQSILSQPGDTYDDYSAQTQSADTPSMDSLPNEPTPLPSQLLHGTADTTDSLLDAPHTSSHQLPGELEPQETPTAAMPPSHDLQPQSTPSLLDAQDSSAPSDAPSPNTLAKRPFEADAGVHSQADLTVNGQEGGYEPDSKRARMEPSLSLNQEQQLHQTGEIMPSHYPTGIKAEGSDFNLDPSFQSQGMPINEIKAEQGHDQATFTTSADAEGDGDAEDAEDALGDMDYSGMNDSSIMPQDTSLDQSGVMDQSGMVNEPTSYSLPIETSGQGDEQKPDVQEGDISLSASTSAPPPQQVQAMPSDQKKYALSMLRTLKKKREATIFLQPVDPVALGIEHYVKIITHPMDLSTVERKLQNHQYASAEQFRDDVNLIWNNCYTFNGTESPFSESARVLSAMFDKQMQKMPTLASIQAREAEKVAMKEAAREATAKRSISPGGSYRSKKPPARRTSNAGAGPPMNFGASVMKNKSKKPGSGGMPTGSSLGSSMSGRPGSAQYAQMQQLQMQQQQAQMQIQQMQQMQQQQNSAAVLNQEQLKFCRIVMNELFDQKHSAFVYPFYEPVDWVALEIPDYPKIIRRPMDLSTMSRKLEHGKYNSATAFENDFKLLINNCFTFNGPASPVNQMGDKLRILFYEKWRELPQYVDPMMGGGGWGGPSGGYGDGFGYQDEDDNGMDYDQINMMQKQLELLTGNLEMMRNKARMKQQHRTSMGGSMSGMSGMPYAGSPPLYGAPSQILPPPQIPIPIAKPPVRAPPVPAAPRVRPPPKRKLSESYIPPAAAPAAPKPRTTKNSKAVGGAAADRSDRDYTPPARGGNTSDYEEEEGEAAITFDMKRELAEKIQEYTEGSRLDRVVEIIRNSAPNLIGGADNQEIELDIDQLDQRTLLKLYEYVVKPIGKGRQLKPKKNKPKGRNRGVDEVAEEERINALQATLDAMEGTAGVPGLPNLPQMPAAPPVAVELPVQAQQGGRGDVASSSSEEDEDGDPSDSESDGFAPSP